MKLFKLAKGKLSRTIKRIANEMWDDKSTFLTGLFLLGVIETVVYLLQVDRERFTLGFVDAFPLLSYTMGISMIPIGTAFVIMMLHNEFRNERILKKRDVRKVWRDACLKVTIASVLLSAGSVIWCCFIAKITTKEWCVWNQYDSLYCFWTNNTMENISVGKVVWLFGSAYFLSVWAGSMVVLLIYWRVGRYDLGILIISIVSVAGNVLHMPFDFYRGIHYYIVASQTMISYQYVYPLMVCFICYLAGDCMKKRDFL